MPSSRVILGELAQVDVDRLLDAAIRLAKQHLADASEFAPFAIVAGIDGRLHEAEFDLTSLGKHPGSAEIVEATTTHLRAIAPNARGTALTVNTRLSERKTDAVEVRLEHYEGGALLALLPYKRPRFSGAIDFGDLMIFPATPEIWN
ncbi:MAG: hypothetical protein ACOH10_12000 [Rhodoglobus sp.]